MRTQLLAVLCVWIAASSPAAQTAHAQDADPGPLTGEAILKSAKDFFADENNRKAVNSKTALDYEWFRGFRGTVKETNRSLQVVARDLPVSGPRLSVADRARPGDVIRVRWQSGGKDRGQMAVYVGEESFPGASKKQSFFIYPYRTGMEYNTLPPRKHEESLQAEYSDLKLSLLYSFSDPDAQHGGRRWLRPNLWVDKGELYHPSTMLDGPATFSVYRAQDVVALKAAVPYHMQLQPDDSCLFAAYANLATYRGKNPHTGDKRISQFERDLIEAEVLHPQAKDARDVAAFLKASNLKENLPKDNLQHWILVGYNTRWTAPAGSGMVGMEAVADDPNLDEFREVIRKHVGQDDPLLVLLKLAKGSPWEELGAKKKDQVGTLQNYERVKIPPRKGLEEFGHAAVVTGLRYDADEKEWLVYFVTTSSFNASPQNGWFVAKLSEFHRSLQQPGDGTVIDIGDPLNKDKQKTLPKVYHMRP